MSPDARRHAWLLSAALLMGVLANLLFGASPGKVKPLDAADPAWQPVTMRVPQLAGLDATWEARAPWGAAPKPVEPPPPPPPPPPTPVGIVGAGSAKQAIFMIHGAGELRVGVGGVLPDGGRVQEVSAKTVVWLDGEGVRHERRMFLAPVDLPASTAPAGSQQPSALPGGTLPFPGPIPGLRSSPGPSSSPSPSPGPGSSPRSSPRRPPGLSSGS